MLSLSQANQRIHAKLIQLFNKRVRLNYSEHPIVVSLYDGMLGMGVVGDEELDEYLSPKQVDFIEAKWRKYFG